MERVAVFIDGGYLAKLLDAQGRPKVDFAKLAALLTGSDHLVRTYYYNAPPYKSPRPTPDEIRRLAGADNFHKALQAIPRFEVRLGKLAYRGVGQAGQPIYVQKGVDILLCVDMLTLSLKQKIDKVCLLAGDSDFVPAVKASKDEGVIFSLWHGPRTGERATVDRELWDLCDERTELTPEVMAEALR